jgi:6-phosphogluconolactonase
MLIKTALRHAGFGGADDRILSSAAASASKKADHKRRWSAPRVSVLAALTGLLLLAPAAPAADYFMYAGTYTNQQGKGIYAWRFHPQTGQLLPAGLVAETSSPSFLAVHPTRRFLYAVNELSSYQGQQSGSVSAFAIDRVSGKLTLLNTVSSRGDGPCHLALDHTGKCLLVANYGGGSVAAFPVGDDGRLGEAAAFFQHAGVVALAERQGGPHAHGILVSPNNRFALVADLGLDEVLVYRLDASRASLAPNHPPFAKVGAGAGPRHLAFHPNGRLVYAINEIQSTVTAFSYRAAAGTLQQLRTVSTLPQDFRGQNITAEIVVHPSGKFLYGSNRGHDSIAVFAIQPSGTLDPVQHVSTQGKTPRNFAIDPTGAYLFAANQNSDSIVLFRIDSATGHLSPAGVVLDTPSPVCITFVREN